MLSTELTRESSMFTKLVRLPYSRVLGSVLLFGGNFLIVIMKKNSRIKVHDAKYAKSKTNIFFVKNTVVIRIATLITWLSDPYIADRLNNFFPRRND